MCVTRSPMSYRGWASFSVSFSQRTRRACRALCGNSVSSQLLPLWYNPPPVRAPRVLHDAKHGEAAKACLSASQRIARPQQGAQLAIGEAVAVASRLLQALAVEHRDLAVRIPDQARLLQDAGGDRDGRAVHAEHVGDEVL